MITFKYSHVKDLTKLIKFNYDYIDCRIKTKILRKAFHSVRHLALPTVMT